MARRPRSNGRSCLAGLRLTLKMALWAAWLLQTPPLPQTFQILSGAAGPNLGLKGERWLSSRSWIGKKSETKQEKLSTEFLG